MPDTGDLHIAGMRQPQQRADIARISALVPQEYAFYPTLTVHENLNFFARAIGLRSTGCATAMERVTAATHLHTHLRQRAEHLSGGLKRRLNLAIGLLGEPELLYLDEPTVGIDPQSRHFILDTIKAMAANGTTVVYSSHYMDEIEFLAQNIAIIDHGRVLAQGNLTALLATTGAQIQLSLPHAPTPALQQQLLTLKNININGCALTLHGDTQTLARLLDLLNRFDSAPQRIQQGLRNLEDLFMQLTQRSLRD